MRRCSLYYGLIFQALQICRCPQLSDQQPPLLHRLPLIRSYLSPHISSLSLSFTTRNLALKSLKYVADVLTTLSKESLDDRREIQTASLDGRRRGTWSTEDYPRRPHEVQGPTRGYVTCYLAYWERCPTLRYSTKINTIGATMLSRS